MNLRDQLKRDEGVKLKPYVDSVGKLTVGVGHNLTDNGISQAVCDVLLDEDLANVQSALDSHLPWWKHLDEARGGVLQNMAFNLGIMRLLDFRKMLAAVERGDWSAASYEMLNSKWAQQVGKRADRLALQMELGTWQ